MEYHDINLEVRIESVRKKAKSKQNTGVRIFSHTLTTAVTFQNADKICE